MMMAGRSLAGSRVVDCLSSSVSFRALVLGVGYMIFFAARSGAAVWGPPLALGN